MYKTLKELRETQGQSTNNIFKSFGLDYKYLDDGHNIQSLVDLFKSVKDIDHPIVLHIHTIKGKGLPYAEKDRESWHAGGPFNVEDGSPKFKAQDVDDPVFDSIKELLNELKKEHQLVITIEDGELMSGYGQNIASFYGNSDMKVLNYGISKAFHTDFDPDELLKENGISQENLTNVIKSFVK